MISKFGRIGWLAAWLTVALVGDVACAIDGDSWLPGGATRALNQSRATEVELSDIEFVIPAGTAAASMRGDAAFQLPSRIAVAPGQAIVIVNRDYAMHYFFDAPVAPGTTLRTVFTKIGEFGYSGGLTCSIDKAASSGVIVTVDPKLARR